MAVRWYASTLSSGRDSAASNENVVDYLDLDREKLDDETALKVVPKRLRRRLKRFRTIKHASNLKVMAYYRQQNLRRCKKLYRKQSTIRCLRYLLEAILFVRGYVRVSGDLSVGIISYRGLHVDNIIYNTIWSISMLFITKEVLQIIIVIVTTIASFIKWFLKKQTAQVKLL